jgi:hypothetical protein
MNVPYLPSVHPTGSSIIASRGNSAPRREPYLPTVDRVVTAARRTAAA